MVRKSYIDNHPTWPYGEASTFQVSAIGTPLLTTGSASMWIHARDSTKQGKVKRSSYGFNKQLKGKNKVIFQKDLLFSFGDFIFQKERISAEAESKSTCLMDKRRIQCFAMISN